MLDNVGCHITMKESSLKLLERIRTELEALKLNGLYIVKNVHIKEHGLIAQSCKDDNHDLWHKRLSSICEGGLKQLLNQGIIKTRGMKTA